jgi:hypothetical protein
MRDPITVEAVAAIVTHPDGGLKGVPEAARVAIAVAKVDEATADVAEDLRALLAECDRLDRVLLVPHH